MTVLLQLASCVFILLSWLVGELYLLATADKALTRWTRTKDIAALGLWLGLALLMVGLFIVVFYVYGTFAVAWEKN
jgi:hypothetical protein